MSFAGFTCIVTTMKNSGFSDILEDDFGGVDRMMTCKNFLQNVCTLRLLAEVILQGPPEDQALHSKDKLDEF